MNGLIRLESGADGQGLSFSISPGYGDTTGEIQKIWQQGLRDDAIAVGNNGNGTDSDHAMKLDTRLGWGLPAPAIFPGRLFGDPFGGDGMLTPYTEMILDDGSDSYRLGLNWKLNTRFELDLVGEHRKSAGDAAIAPAENAVLLKGTVYF